MKKTDRNIKLLLSIFVVSIIMANVTAARVIATNVVLFGIPITLSGGTLTYAFSFLSTDIVGELWGKQKAKEFVLFGFVGQLFSSCLISLTALLPAIDSSMDNCYKTLLGTSWIFFIGSMIAYLLSQTWDVYIFHRLRDYFVNKTKSNKHRWIWNNASTMTSQLIDTIVFSTISYGFGLGWLTHGQYKLFIGQIIGQYIFKFIIALLDTPIFYVFTKTK